MHFFVSRLDKSLSSSNSSSSSSLTSSTPKDYASAFATLSGRYGLSSAPVRPKKKASKPSLATPMAPTPSPASSTTSLYMPGLTYTSSTSSKSKAPPKNFEAAFAALQSSYGFSSPQSTHKTTRQTSQ